jgi:hypothetical protein
MEVVMSDEFKDKIALLREECNRQITEITLGDGEDTPGFRRINRMLKFCDAVFLAADKAKRTGDAK